jgi:hypothetical protein
MAQGREINPVVAGIIILVVVALVGAFMWYRAQPSTQGLPTQAPPGFGGVPAAPR